VTLALSNQRDSRCDMDGIVHRGNQSVTSIPLSSLRSDNSGATAFRFEEPSGADPYAGWFGEGA